ncbi:hypothetical protein [Novosphingobium sp.]|uniref:hypothetical protein n=1 Tax=Novosphingobium sp. TaxID=1874826 RepID=UPI003BA8E7B9
MSEKDLKAFEAHIANLRIEVSKDADGLLTVCSSSEPLFCYDVHDEDGVNALVIDTLASYGRHFFGLDDLKIGTKVSPVGKLSVPVESAEPFSTIEPVLDLVA